VKHLTGEVQKNKYVNCVFGKYKFEFFIIENAVQLAENGKIKKPTSEECRKYSLPTSSIH